MKFQNTVLYFVMFLEKPVITSLTGNQTVNGTDVSFFCQADAFPTPTAYNWFKNGIPITSGSSADFVNSGQQLTVRSVKKGSAGRYSCSGTNSLRTGEEKSTFLIVQCELFLPFSIIVLHLTLFLNPLIIHSILAYRLSVFFRTSARTSCMYDRFLGCAFQMIEFFQV